MNEQRFLFLMEKYRKGILDPNEYKELIWILGESDIEQVLDQYISQEWKKDSKSTDGGVSNLVKMEKRLYRKQYTYIGVGASLFFLMSVFLFLWDTQKPLSVDEMIYRTGFGERIEIALDDGSKITLNANSIFKWTGNWKNTRNRNASLVGEAYFEVSKQDGIPFSVYTNDVVVEVLGTSFNVDSRNKATKVYLDEGKVNLKLNEENEEIMKTEKVKREVVLSPGEQVSYDARKKMLEKLDGQTIYTAAAWKINVLNFKNMQFSEVLDLLNEIYGLSFECSDRKLLNTRMYIGVPYSNWEAVRQALELSLNIRFLKRSEKEYLVKK
ncbi:MAG TPA: FecR family protein [Agriterribacter sp.]|nr:FecR family protein [Agriterribacter sp.]